jgi:hypothetical protein
MPCSEERKIDMRRGLPSLLAMDNQEAAILLSRVLQQAVADTAHMEKRDNSQLRRKKRKMSKQPNNKFVS